MIQRAVVVCSISESWRIEMNWSRGAGRTMLTVMLGFSVVMAGCSNSWVDEAEQISAALIPAAANLVTLVAALQGHSVSAQDLTTIQNAGTQAGADLQLVQSLVNAYQKADAAAQPGILSQIQSALNAAQGNLQGILPALHIKDAATQAKITAVLGILISEVQSLAAVVPLVQGPAVARARIVAPESQDSHSASAMGVETTVGHELTPLSARDFVKSYNSVMTAKSGNPSLDSSTRASQVHLHGAAVRWISGGVLQ